MAIEDGEKGVNLEVKSSRGRRIERVTLILIHL